MCTVYKRYGMLSLTGKNPLLNKHLSHWNNVQWPYIVRSERSNVRVSAYFMDYSYWKWTWANCLCSFVYALRRCRRQNIHSIITATIFSFGQCKHISEGMEIDRIATDCSMALVHVKRKSTFFFAPAQETYAATVRRKTGGHRSLSAHQPRGPEPAGFVSIDFSSVGRGCDGQVEGEDDASWGTRVTKRQIC